MLFTNQFLLASLKIMLAVLGDHWDIIVVILRSDEKQDPLDALLDVSLVKQEVLLLLLVMNHLLQVIEDEFNLHLDVLLEAIPCCLRHQALEAPISSQKKISYSPILSCRRSGISRAMMIWSCLVANWSSSSSASYMVSTALLDFPYFRVCLALASRDATSSKILWAFSANS